jgi:hypothetical protein
MPPCPAMNDWLRVRSASSTASDPSWVHDDPVTALPRPGMRRRPLPAGGRPGKFVVVNTTGGLAAERRQVTRVLDKRPLWT